MKSTIDNTKDIIGTASKGARDARKELVKRFLEMKQNQEKQLLEFKTNIRSRKDDNKYRMYRTLCWLFSSTYSTKSAHIHQTYGWFHPQNWKYKATCWLLVMQLWHKPNVFANCPINEILSADRIAYHDFDKANFKIKCPPTEYLNYLLKSVLENNIFEFNGQLFQQIIGAAIGATPSCEACDIPMYQIIKEILSKFKGRKNIFSTADTEMTASWYTLEISMTSLAIAFLDVNIYKGKRFFNDSILDMKTYSKPTNSFLYLFR